MDATDRVSFINIVGNEGVVSVMQKFLSFGDLRSLNVACETARTTVSTIIASWPEEIIEFLLTYNSETPSSFFVAGVVVKDEKGDYIRQRPIIQLDTDALGYDSERNKLIGDPWSIITLNNRQPRLLGIYESSACFADEGRSQVFQCQCTTAAVHNNNLGTWTVLPQMPEYRFGAGVFRVGPRIYVLGGQRVNDMQSILCFDIALNQWVDSGIDSFPGHAHKDFTTIVLDHGNVIVAGGMFYHGEVFDRSKQAFALDVFTGVWTEMPDLPEDFKDDSCLTGHCAITDEHPDGIAVIMGKETWASLVDGEWVVNPNLRGAGMKALRLSSHGNKLFVGDGFVDLPAQEKIDYDMTLEFPDITNRLVIV